MNFMDIRRGKNVTLLTVVVGAAVVVVAGFLLVRPIQEYWYISKLDSGDALQKHRAAEKLIQMRSRRSEKKFIENLRNGDLLEKITAVHALGKLGSVGSIPDLLLILRQRAPPPASAERHRGMSTGLPIYPDVRQALVNIGNPAVPSLNEILQDPKVNVRLAAAEILAEIAHDADESANPLTAILKEEYQSAGEHRRER